MCRRSVREAAVSRSVLSTIVNVEGNGRFSKLRKRCKMFKATKSKREKNQRPGHKAKKRRFCGNRYTSENETLHASTSAQKLKNSRDTEIAIDPMHGYRIINFISVFSTLSALLKCKECESDVKFNVKGEQGLGFKICVVCNCGPTEIDSCPKISNKSFEINRRIVFVMRLLGIGLQGINLFCGMMDLGQGMAVNTYYSCLENVSTAARATADVLLGKAAEEEAEKNSAAGNMPSHLTVSGDGTRGRRGLSLLFGAVALIGKYSNKILDFVVKSKFCQACNHWSGKESTEEFDSWYEQHEEHCACNRTGSAEKMEVDGIIEMFTRSEELHGVKYASYIGNGDTFKSLSEKQPYGDELIVTKKECVGHTQNNNERFNAILWHLAPKHIFCSKKIIEMASFITVCIFNEGITPLLRMMEVMGVTIGPQAKIMVDKRDMMHVEKADVTHSAASKEARLARRLERMAQEEFFEEEEGVLYRTGIAD